ncbi:MAG: hypothetical protein ORN55_09335 [Chitinophagaceae bacterium]|nr:hypothetical protein [Chitinophagaceae bacterium]
MENTTTNKITQVKYMINGTSCNPACQIIIPNKKGKNKRREGTCLHMK